jgi:hypothetical protein
MGGTTSGAGTSGGGTSAAGAPPLHVEGNKLLDPNGNTVVLRGVDLIDVGVLYAYSGMSAAAITGRIDKILAVGFAPKVVRLAVYPRTTFNGGFPYNSPLPFPVGTGGAGNGPSADDYIANLLRPTVDYLAQKGLYAIIDFHQIDNTDGQSGTDATTFWQAMAPAFAQDSNVIYETFNEPIDTSTSWATFKVRAQGWVDTIRASAPNNIVIVPSMSWDQKPGDASASPLAGENLVYAMHIYPSNWNSTTKQQLATAVAKVPVFISEWGYMLNSSDMVGGASDPTWFSSFRTLVDGNGASWSAWVTDDQWTPNLFADAALTKLTDFGTNTKQWLSDTAAP